MVFRILHKVLEGKRVLGSILFLLMFATSWLDSAAQLVVHKSECFTSLYDLQLQMPRQVEWTLHAADIGDVKREPSWIFFNDLHVPGSFARHSDFTRSGYDRGHLCPAADRSASMNRMRSTFSLANVCPQVPALNRGTWKVTEDSCRHMAQLYDSIRVIVVPVILQDDTTRIGAHHLAVPHAFIKVAWSVTNDSILGQWFFWNR